MNKGSKKEVKLIEVPDEPPPSYNNVFSNWLSRVVVSFEAHSGLREATESFINDISFRRKLSRVGRFAKFY